MTDISSQDIPHLEARVDIDNSYKESSLNLHPSQDLMNQAYKVRIELAGIGSEVNICDPSTSENFVKNAQTL